MVARDYINTAIPELKPTNTVDKALQWMEEYKVSHLPVVHNHSFLGIIPEEILLEAMDYNSPVKNYANGFLDVFITGNRHIFDVFQLAAEHKLSIVPVANEEKGYEGVISLQDMVSIFSTLSSLKSPGAILLLRMKATDYSLSELSRLIESNGAKILSSYVMSENDPTSLLLCTKLNRQDISAVIATLERYEYNIVAKFSQEEIKETNQDNLDQLFKYLNI